MRVCPLPASLLGASWGRDGTIVFGLSQPGGLWRVPAVGGVPEPLTAANAGETHAFPDVLPNGAGVVFMIGRPNGFNLSDTRIAVVDLRTSEQRVIVETGTSPRYASGHIVYAVGNALLAVPFDLERLTITGDPVPMVDGVLTKSSGATSFALSETGSLVYVTTGAGGAGLRTAVWIDRTGQEETLSLPPRAYQNPRLSPDGTRLAVGADVNGSVALWVYSVTTGAGLRLTQQGATNAPVWLSNDRIAFWSNVDGGSGQIDVVEADGSGHPEQMLGSPPGIFGDFPTSVDPARHYLLFTRLLTSAHREIFRLPLQRGRRGGAGAAGSIQPRERGTVARWPVAGLPVRPVGRDGCLSSALPAARPDSAGIDRRGASVTWFPDGKALGYRLGDRMMSVSVDTDAGAPRIGRPTELFRGSYYASLNGTRQYHIAPDGRFLMLKSSPESTEGALPPQVVLVQNWFQELSARVPTK